MTVGGFPYKSNLSRQQSQQQAERMAISPIPYKNKAQF
jgi:hypothetical protein